MIIIKFDNICFSSTPSKEKVSPQSNHQQEECNSVKYNLSEDGGGRGLFVSCTIHSQSDLISCTLKLECRRYCDAKSIKRSWLVAETFCVPRSCCCPSSLSVNCRISFEGSQSFRGYQHFDWGSWFALWNWNTLLVDK